MEMRKSDLYYQSLCVLIPSIANILHVPSFIELLLKSISDITKSSIGTKILSSSVLRGPYF